MVVGASFNNRIACAVYSRAAFPLLRRVFPVNPLVVYYHLVSDRQVAHVQNLYAFKTVSQFKRDMETLLRFFQPVSLQDFLQILDGKRRPARNSFLLTFDDGLKECYEIIAPILRLHGIPATFFLCSAFVDNKELAYDHKKSLLSDAVRSNKVSSVQKEQVRATLERAGIAEPSLVAGLLRVDYGRRLVLDEIATLLDYDFTDYLNRLQPYLTSGQVASLLKMGHAVGAHSIDHPRYSDLTLPAQLHQTRESVRFVKERFSINYGAFSFPHSDANVSTTFFRETLGDGEVDVCFGNQGLMEEPVRRNVQDHPWRNRRCPPRGFWGKCMPGVFEIDYW